jgi:hypothetical protein
VKVRSQRLYTQNKEAWRSPIVAIFVKHYIFCNSVPLQETQLRSQRFAASHLPTATALPTPQLLHQNGDEVGVACKETI